MLADFLFLYRKRAYNVLMLQILIGPALLNRQNLEAEKLVMKLKGLSQ